MKANKWIKRIFFLLGAYAVMVLGFYLLQPFYVFQPGKLNADYAYNFDGPFTEAELNVDPNVSLNLVHFPALGTRKGAILYFHGNSDNLQRWGQYHDDFTKRGYDIWMYDYRGFGKSTGKPGDQVFYSDAKKVFDWVQKKYPDEDLILYGRSLGTSIASELATQVSCDSLILEAPFDNLTHLFQMKFPWLWQPFGVQYDFANDQNLALGIQAPIHIIHGTSDFVIPYQSSIYLKEHLMAKDSHTLIYGGGHKNLHQFTNYQRQLSRLLQRS